MFPFTNATTVYKEKSQAFYLKKQKTKTPLITNKCFSEVREYQGQHTKTNHIPVYWQYTTENQNFKNFITYNSFPQKTYLGTNLTKLVQDLYAEN